MSGYPFLDIGIIWTRFR